MSEPFIGQITMFGGNFAPRNWAFCDGQLLAINTNTALFSILGTTYGGDGRTTFALPDLRSRSPMHEGTGPGLPTIRLGERTGAATTTLSANNLPSRSGSTPVTDATVKCQAATGDATTPVGNTWAPDAGVSSATYGTGAATANMQTGTVQVPAMTVNLPGNNQPFNNVHPVLGINFIIALFGVFPSRN